jgi:N-acetylmuramoyl-L-alanine amidase
MPTFAFYLFKVMLCSAVLYGYYQLFLRNKVYHAYNRFYLLVVVVVALLAPLVNFTMLYSGSSAAGKPIQLLQVVNSGDEYLEEIIVYSHRSHISISQLLTLLYTLISLFLLGALINMLAAIFTILKTNGSRRIKEIIFVETDAKGSPFSFFKFIFWNRAIDVHSQTGQQIFAHELAHVREKHSMDKLFLNLVLIIYWVNPFFWLIKKELNLIHEFTADKKAIENNDAGALAAMIVTSAYPKHAYLLTNHFFYSPIKRRLQMLSKYNSTKAGYFYRILALPVVLFFVAAFTIKTKAGIENMMNPAKKITVVIDAGHGGQDDGARGLDGSLEKDLNLAFVKRIKELNQVPNINLVFTRVTDVYQTPQEKAAIAKNAGADLFISIHTSSEPFATATKTGMEVFVSRDEYTNSQASKLFASAIIDHFQKNYGLDVAAAPIQGKTGILVLQQNAFPSIIIETGYMSNKNDLAYLQSAKAKDDFAKNILEAISQYADNINDQTNLHTPAAKNAIDTVPRIAVDLGNYKGEKIKSVSVSKDCEVVELKLGNGKTVSMSLNEAKKQHLVASVPVKQSDPVVVSFNNLDISKNVDASQKVSINNAENEVKIIAENINIKVNENAENHPLILLDGKEISKAEMNNINPESIESINVLKGKAAESKYDAKRTLNGVIEIISKKDGKNINPSKNAIAVVEHVIDSHPHAEMIFTKLENEAEFPGGKEAWSKYLMRNLNAGLPLDEGWPEGVFKVVVRFIVAQDGTISDVVAENYKDSKTAKMCVDLISKGPNWIPGKQNGKIVNSYKKQPITFVIQSQ